MVDPSFSRISDAFLETPSVFPRLLEGAVHVWRAPLASAAEDASRLVGLLSDDEKARAERFRFEVHRDRFIAARARLRLLLGAYTDLSPSDLRFRYLEHGKPVLADDSGELRIEFNVSHSADVGLFVFSSGCESGVDVEEIRLERDFLDIAERFFTARENERLRAAGAEEQGNLFFSIWTRKEAYLKARGVGITESLQSIDVCEIGEGGRVNLRVEGSPLEQARDWCLVDLPAEAGFKAAVCVDGTPTDLHLWNATS